MSEPTAGPASKFPSIERKYGKPIQEWKAILRSSRLTTWKDLTALLTWEYGMGQGHANALVLHTLREG